MQFYVKLKREGPESLDIAQSSSFVEDCVIPSLQKLTELQTQGKIKSGGMLTGERALVFLLEAASIEECDSVLRSLPLWPFVNVKVRPLTPFDARLKLDRTLLEKLKQPAGRR